MPSRLLRRALAPLTAAALLCTMILPASAFFWSRKEAPAVADVTRNVLIGEELRFSSGDFPVTGDSGQTLSSITLTSLPNQGTGVLCVGSQALEEGAVIQASALDGLRFQTLTAPTAHTASFTFLPTFSSGEQGDEVTVELYLLKEQNLAPIAENLSLTTYRNVPVTGYFSASDGEGDTLTFQITSSPARGSVTLSEDGSSRFVYTPYENKTGKDSFTYVAMDTAGNLSNPAKVSLRIEKADTSVTYADMAGHEDYKAAIRLAEEGIFVGEQVSGTYFFDPDAEVTRSQFLTMAMSAVGLEPLEQVSLTGFADDQAIPTWAKGYVSSALKSGVIQGTRDETGQVIFSPDTPITRGEATVMLNNLLEITDVAVQTWGAVGIPEETAGHWAGQAAVNLAASGVIRAEDSAPLQLDARLTRADVAGMLDASLDLLEERDGGWF